MKVNRLSGALGAYQQTGARRVAQVEEAARLAKGDGVELSREAQEVLTLKERISQAPEVRQERVAALKRQIEAGTYRPAGRDIAAKMLKARLFDET